MAQTTTQATSTAHWHGWLRSRESWRLALIECKRDHDKVFSLPHLASSSVTSLFSWMLMWSRQSSHSCLPGLQLSDLPVVRNVNVITTRFSQLLTWPPTQWPSCWTGRVPPYFSVYQLWLLRWVSLFPLSYDSRLQALHPCKEEKIIIII